MDELTINSFSDLTQALQMMRDELTVLGIKELRTPDAIETALGVASGTTLLVFNSVCGCAAGNARPAIGLALQNAIIPDSLYTVFAGQDRDATERARQYIPDQPPSSPSVALFQDGKLVYMMHRHMIESRTPNEIAHDLTTAFNAHCQRKGPSIPAEVFASTGSAKICGSQFSTGR